MRTVPLIVLAGCRGLRSPAGTQRPRPLGVAWSLRGASQTTAPARFYYAVLALVAAMLLAARQDPAQAGDANSVQTSPACKLRIVSLAPSATEILFSLHLGDCIVGATNYCDYPPAAKSIPRVGGLGSPNLEKLIELHPDLVIATDFERKDYPQVIRDAGIKVLAVQIRNFQEMFDAITQIGQATGATAQATELVAGMKGQLQEITQKFQSVAPPGRPRVYVEIWNDPIITAGGQSFLDDVIQRAGGVNVAHDIDQASPKVSAEMVVQWNPQVILVCHGNHAADSVKDVTSRIGWADIAAVKNGRVIDDISSDILLRPGPRLIDGVRTLSRRLYPQAATQPATGPVTTQPASK